MPEPADLPLHPLRRYRDKHNLRLQDLAAADCACRGNALADGAASRRALAYRMVALACYSVKRRIRYLAGILTENLPEEQILPARMAVEIA